LVFFRSQQVPENSRFRNNCAATYHHKTITTTNEKEAMLNSYYAIAAIMALLAVGSFLKPPPRRPRTAVVIPPLSKTTMIDPPLVVWHHDQPVVIAAAAVVPTEGEEEQKEIELLKTRINIGHDETRTMTDERTAGSCQEDDWITRQEELLDDDLVIIPPPPTFSMLLYYRTMTVIAAVIVVVCFNGLTILWWRRRDQLLRFENYRRELDAILRTGNNNHINYNNIIDDIPHSYLLDDDDDNMKTLFLLSLRTNLVHANLLDGQDVAANEFQQRAIDPLRWVLSLSSSSSSSSLPHRYQDVDPVSDDDDNDDDDDDDDVQQRLVPPPPPQQRRDFPGLYGRTVRRILHGWALATFDSVYYDDAARNNQEKKQLDDDDGSSSSSHSILHPRLNYANYRRDGIFQRETQLEGHHDDDHQLSRALIASFQLNILLAIMLGQYDSARELESIVDWLETTVAATGVPVIPFSVEERRRRWRMLWRSSAEQLSHVRQVLRDLAERVVIRSEHLHCTELILQLLHDPYQAVTDQRVYIYADHVQRAFGYKPDRFGLQLHARAVAAFWADRESDNDGTASPRALGAIVTTS
jgi:hypothetical protein